MGKKTSRQSTKVGSAASPADGLSQSGSKSSILRAAFSPSEYQLALFASVIQGLDAQHLRIHDTNTGKLQCEHALAPKETITSLDWGYYNAQERRATHPRRSASVGLMSTGDIVVAFGTSTSDIRLYSPSEDKVVGTLTGVHDKGIKDFKFTAGRPGQEAWSIGGDNKLVQWDLLTGQSSRTIHLPASSVFTAISRPVPSTTPVICASQTPFLIDIEATEEPLKFPAMRNQIHTVISSSSESAGAGTFLAADGERFINVFDASNQKLVRNLDVSSVSLFDAGNSAPEKQILAAVTENGTIELFTKPFAQPQAAQSTSAKAARKQMTQKANASLKIIRSRIFKCMRAPTFQGPEIIVAYAEGGVIPVFERVKLLDETTDELAFTGVKAVVKSKSSSAVAFATTNGSKNVGESQVNETHAVVEQGNFVDDDVDMNDDAASVSGNEDSDDEAPKPATEKRTKPTKLTADEDVEMQNDEDEDEDEEEDGAEPSFGELLRANIGHEVDVEAEMDEDVNLGALVPGKPTAAVQQIPTGVSLATVLTQSLKTNDNDMLESCFHTNDISIIRTTIQRLESSLAATLLQKLAERLSSRPGRYGHLLVWVQWTCVAHGGALAGQPELLKRMATLYKVMDQRSSSLPSLLLLKGKLDMLDAQLGLRSSMRGDGEDMDSEDEDNVIYVEGQEDDSDSETETKPRKSIREQTFDEDESMMNGIDESEDEEDGSEEEDEEEEGMLDIEAEESAGSSDAEESLEENEDDEDDEGVSEGSLVDFIADTEDESDDAIEQPPPTKKSKTVKKKGGRK
ncbi:Small-subunit processome Utp12 [Penicillium atrosanguineum]|nr:Small-subunit processome Utp12 [Penicillium atrosanguineum]